MKTVFVKYSNERSDSFSIKTIIEQDESGKRYVKKLPLTDEAVSHVKSMLDYGRRIDEIYSEGGFLLRLFLQLTMELPLSTLSVSLWRMNLKKSTVMVILRLLLTV